VRPACEVMYRQVAREKAEKPRGAAGRGAVGQVPRAGREQLRRGRWSRERVSLQCRLTMECTRQRAALTAWPHFTTICTWQRTVGWDTTETVLSEQGAVAQRGAPSHKPINQPLAARWPAAQPAKSPGLAMSSGTAGSGKQEGGSYTMGVGQSSAAPGSEQVTGINGWERVERFICNGSQGQQREEGPVFDGG